MAVALALQADWRHWRGTQTHPRKSCPCAFHRSCPSWPWRNLPRRLQGWQSGFATETKKIIQFWPSLLLPQSFRNLCGSKKKCGFRTMSYPRYTAWLNASIPPYIVAGAQSAWSYKILQTPGFILALCPVFTPVWSFLGHCHSEVSHFEWKGYSWLKFKGFPLCHLLSMFLSWGRPIILPTCFPFGAMLLQQRNGLSLHSFCLQLLACIQTKKCIEI